MTSSISHNHKGSSSGTSVSGFEFNIQSGVVEQAISSNMTIEMSEVTFNVECKKGTVFTETEARKVMEYLTFREYSFLNIASSLNINVDGQSIVSIAPKDYFMQIIDTSTKLSID